MHLFKFTDSTKTNLINGQTIDGYDSAMWVERYRTPGEFELVAPLSSGLKTFLPLGTIISHTDTLEFAIVENHEINEEKDADPIVTITGRSFDSYLENRIVGMQIAVDDAESPYVDFVLSSDNTWNQAVSLINRHIHGTFTIDDNETLNNNIVAATVTPGSGTSVARLIKRSPVHKALLDLLAVDDLGIRMVRKNPFGVLGNNTTSYFMIHHGIDHSNDVIFSASAGELEQAQYLWSLKGLKNVALVQGRFVEEIVPTVYTGPLYYDRRVMLVNASDVDESYSAPPSGADLIAVRAAMYIRGLEALANQNELNIASTAVSKLTQYEYRKDYDIGDIVSIDGNYGEIEQRRVVEYVEIEDKNGYSGHPTLAVLP